VARGGFQILRAITRAASPPPSTFCSGRVPVSATGVPTGNVMAPMASG
jgi:hypothetical protein